ncbi:UNVERIFIED_CONTAM: hypothetical protein HDU68_004411 [Siphonaria sp. JEL0065]|nr:hypothetical protein HDU68_004411 [Siphonaria sp. JEL0065]
MVFVSTKLKPLASRFSRFQSSNSLSSIADRLRLLQGQDGGPRLALKTQGDAFRITVVGDALVGKEELVNALLENSQVPEVINERKTLNDALNDSDVVTVAYGSNYSKTANSTQKQTDIELGLEWLRNYNAKIVLVPSTASVSTIAENVNVSDLTILVTSADAPLSAKVDSEFLKIYADKPNIVIAVNSKSDSTSHSVSDTTSYISARLVELSSASSLPIFPINTKTARSAQQDITSPSFAQKWTFSGVQDLKTTILNQISSETSRTSLQASTTSFSARTIATRLSEDAQTSIQLLEAVQKRVQNVVFKSLVQEQERLRSGFVESDLSGVGEKVGGLLASLREYFRGFGVLGLVWRSDTVGADLEARVRGNSLSQAEYRMTYAVGKLNEGLYTLYSRTRSELSSLSSDTHPLSAYTSTKDLQSDISRIIDILDKQAPASVKKNNGGGVQVDAFVLKNLVSSGFDVSSQIETVEKKADYTVRSLFASQLLFATGGVFATYLGVPWAVSIPATVLVGGAGVAFQSLRWSSVQDRFISQITEEQKTLEAKLLDTYDREFTRVVSDPLASIVKMLNSAIGKRLVEAKEAKAQIDALIKEIDQVAASGSSK